MLSLRSRLTALTEVSDYESDHERNMSPEEEVAKRTRKRDRKRKKIIRELFESEKAYIHHLELVHKHFDFPLRFACIVPDDVHQKLFSNLEQILEVNRQLLEELEHSTVGLSFLHLGPFLKLYATYANDHEQALSTLQDWHQRSSVFSDFISMQEQRPEVKGLKLNALLITPVQRVPRYQMLLEDLLEHTSRDHHDYNNLCEATKKIKEVAWHINEHIRQHENFQKMLDIQNRLSGSAPKILAPGRLFVKEGCLKKVSRKGGRPLERMFFLFSDMLLYAKPKLLDSGKNTYTCCCVLPLKHCKIEPVFGKPRKDQEGGMFRISCQSESLLLYSTEPGVVNEWSEELVTAVRYICTH
ncbi:rho guanine nucleotide exchange factor 39-like [Liolophura sinensis]|uniref:rho guanine nucleotide exchange factor 39-like n=1 Tax=Liolophura sinensis TaxID=3198878 RepID=UPI00315901D8